MHHAMLDAFAAQHTPVHRLDAAAKTVAALATILATVLVGPDHLVPLVPVAVVLIVYQAVGKVPVGYTAKRLLIVSPFALSVAVLLPFLEPGRTVWSVSVGPWTPTVTEAGLLRAGQLLAKFFLCTWTSLLLLATTRFDAILKGLSRLRVPTVFVMQLAFLYRYLWVLLDEGMRMRMARAARDGGLGPWRVRFHSRVGLVGVLFLRTYDRAERIYWAMLARGFDGTFAGPTQARMRWADWLLLLLVLALGAGVLVYDRVAYG